MNLQGVCNCLHLIFIYTNRADGQRHINVLKRTMRKFFFTLLSLCLTLPIFSQNPIGIDRIINDLDWENCSEADVILAFKDNIEKREKDEVWDNGDVSSFILKNVKVGESLSNANIIVNKFNRKLIKIGGIISERNMIGTEELMYFLKN